MDKTKTYSKISITLEIGDCYYCRFRDGERCELFEEAVRPFRLENGWNFNPCESCRKSRSKVLYDKNGRK